MNKLKGKLESYVVSTMEENQRESLLDNLAMSIEQVEEDAEHCMKQSGVKEINEQESLVEFCRCLLAILSHELKIIHVAETPSFWFVAERISPKDTVKMIYRLGIRQSDSARCQVWVRHALIEGTMGSYLTLLEEDTKILKQSYKTTAFVRDSQKMESAKNMISSIIASIYFNINLDYMSNDGNQVIPPKRRVSTSSADQNIGRRRNKGRESPGNVVTIEDSFYNPDMDTDTNKDSLKHSDTFSLPGDISKSKDVFITDESPIQNKRFYIKDEECSPSNMSQKYLNSSDCFKSKKDEEIQDSILRKEIPADVVTVSSVQTEIYNSSDNSWCSSVDSHMDGCITMDAVIVNMIRVVSDEGGTQKTESALNVYVEDSAGVEADSKVFMSQERDSSISHIEEIECNHSLYENHYKLMKNLPVDETLNSLKNNIDGSIDNNLTSYSETKETSSNGQPTVGACGTLLTDNSDNFFSIICNDEIVSETIPKFENHMQRHNKPDDNIKKTINRNALCDNINNQDLHSPASISQNKFSETSLYEVDTKYETVESVTKNDKSDLTSTNDYSLNINLNEPEKIHSIPVEDNEMISSPNEINCGNGNDISNVPNASHDPFLINFCSDDKLSESASPGSSFPTLNIFGSIIHSQTSAFKVVKRTGDADSHNNYVPPTNNIGNKVICDDMSNLSREDAGRISQNKIDQIINVINEHDRVLENQILKQPIDDLSSSGSIKTEEEYRNQVGTYRKSNPVEGSSQLSNILNNVNVHGSNHDDYFVPGIHNSCDIQNNEFNKYDERNLGMESSTTSMSIPVEASTPPFINVPTTDYGFSSPSTLSTLSSRLFEKTFNRTSTSTLGSSYNSDKGIDDGHLCSDSESVCSAGQSFSMLVDLGITDDFIGMKEDHFSTPDTFMGFSSLEELENAITSCKQLISASQGKSKRRDDLVTHLVQLRLKLHELKNIEVAPKDGKKVLGHKFFKQGSMSSTLECDACAATIFPLLQRVYVCKDCGFHCHGKCLKVLEKPCVHNNKLNNATYELKICPEIPLSAQQYRCADCFQRIPMCDGQFEARLCDYTGQKYCTKCHWNDTFVIPARVVHNWDFSCYKVSRQSKHLIMVLSKKPDIKLQSINAVLFNFVDELRDVRTLRQQIMMMKKYIVSCRIATEERLLLLLQNRQHFVDNSDVYSLQDLLDVHNNVLLNQLSRIHATFGKHIKFECLLCQGKGFICEFCNGDDIIFPFDNHVVGCRCRGTFHRLCYSQNSCPKCERNAQKRLKDVL